MRLRAALCVRGGGGAMGFTFEVIGAVGGTGGSTRRPNAFLAARVGGLWPGEVAGPPLKVSPPGWPGKLSAGPSTVHPFGPLTKAGQWRGRQAV
jgi:hypothetical protein